ncbi:hypothetical protein GCM10009550_76170 [Actinocorallia libanotica]|uniref:Uncharacterized protein n=1 Tax=Actinocorallia libanotica TaxID=46162 RepID=A0ABP4CKW5_9ACTN
MIRIGRFPARTKPPIFAPIVPARPPLTAHPSPRRSVTARSNARCARNPVPGARRNEAASAGSCNAAVA